MVDWEEFLKVTFSHRLAPLVLAGLQAGPVRGVPEHVYATLRRRSRANTLRVMKMVAETERIVERFDRAGCRLTPLKGASLSQTLYDSPATRHCGDLDLIGDAENLDDKVRLLQELGYAIQEPLMTLTAARLRVYSRYWKGITFSHRETGVNVDLHWRLFNSRAHPAIACVQRPTLGGCRRAIDFCIAPCTATPIPGSISKG